MRATPSSVFSIEPHSVQRHLLPNPASMLTLLHVKNVSVLKFPNPNLFPGKVSFLTFTSVLSIYLFLYKGWGLMDSRLTSHLLSPGGSPEVSIVLPLLPEYYCKFIQCYCGSQGGFVPANQACHQLSYTPNFDIQT